MKDTLVGGTIVAELPLAATNGRPETATLGICHLITFVLFLSTSTNRRRRSR